MARRRLLVLTGDAAVIGDGDDARQASLCNHGQGDGRLEAVPQQDLARQSYQFRRLIAVRRRYRATPQQSAAVLVGIHRRRRRGTFTPVGTGQWVIGGEAWQQAGKPTNHSASPPPPP